MKIKWLGHACFLLTDERGIRVLTDPFDEKVGYRLPAVEADIVTTSHNHYDHNNTGVVKGSFVHIARPGSYCEKGLEIKGIPTYHDEDEGTRRGENTVFVFSMDGLRVCHCGDLGHIPTPAQAEAIGPVDILLVPVGGTYTIDAAGAHEVMKLLKPSVTIPMHFKTDVLGFPIDGVNRFLSAAGGGERTGNQEITVNGDSLKQLSRIMVLEYES